MNQSEEIEILELKGEFYGGLLGSNYFEIKVGEDIYKGKVSSAALEQMTDPHLGDTVHAMVTRITKYRKRAQTTPEIHYRLESIFKIIENQGT